MWLEPCNNCNELTTIIVYTDLEPSGYKSLKDKNGVTLCLDCQGYYEIDLKEINRRFDIC